MRVPFVPEGRAAEVLLRAKKETCEECGEEIAVKGYSCQECCEHQDMDVGQCMDCGADRTEEMSAMAYDRAKDFRKYGDM